MSKKEEMQTAILAVHEKYKHLLHMVKVTDEAFYSWLYKFKDFAAVKKAHTFVLGGGSQQYTTNSLIRYLIIANTVYTRIKPDEWLILESMSSDHPQLIELSFVKRELRLTWQRRPKPKRSGST